MKPILVVLDVDSTLIEDEAIELVAQQAGTLEQVASITTRAMHGDLDFTSSLRERVATLAGLPVVKLGVASQAIRLTRGASELVAAVHRANGFVTAISGGFHELLDPIAERLGLDRWRANRFEIAGGALTGNVTGPIIDAEAKASALREWATEFDIPIRRTVAVGDGANDLRMMAAAGLSVAFDAKPIVRSAADVSLPERDLSQLLSLLGLED